LGINILKFDKASYCSKRKIITDDFSNNNTENTLVEISGSIIRDLLIYNKTPPVYLLRPSLSKTLIQIKKSNVNKIFE